MSRDVRSDAGVATVFAITVITGLATVLFVMLNVGSWVLERSRAAAIADIAALAAATSGSCEAAEHVALVNGARVQRCAWQGSDVVVVIETEMRGGRMMISPRSVEAGARAGF